MQFALLIYESPEAFAKRSNEERDAYTGAWRAYYQALVDAGVDVGGNPREVPETGTTVRRKEGKRRVQDGVTGVIGRIWCLQRIFAPLLWEPGVARRGGGEEPSPRARRPACAVKPARYRTRSLRGLS